MAGKMISELPDAGNILGSDQLPLARGATTKSIKGSSLSATFLPFNGGGAITANNATAAVTITQAGAGYALRVNDQSGTDSSPLAIDSNGHFLVGCLSVKDGNGLNGFASSTPFVATLSAQGTDSGLYVKSINGIPLLVDDDAGGSPFIVDKNGKVGIGTDKPSQQLTVVGDISATGNIQTTTGKGLVLNSGSPATYIRRSGAFDGMEFITSNTTRAFIHDNGKVGVGTVAPAANLHVVGTSLLSANNAGDALSITQAGIGNAFRVNDSTNDTNPFVIDKDGKVGVGTATPNAPLTVIGNVSAVGSFISSNNYYLAANQGVITARAGYFGTSVPLAANSKYELEYNLYFKNGTSASVVNYALSASNALGYTNANFIQDCGGSTTASIGTKVGGTGTIIDMGTTDTITASFSASSIVRAIVTTSAAVNVSLALSANNAAGITPLQGSYRKVTLFS